MGVLVNRPPDGKPAIVSRVPGGGLQNLTRQPKFLGNQGNWRQGLLD
jgi:hypothetical protein